MNQLQRIILVNSGNISFQELNLDGNIHFIGTQGTGKSTLLRAILFFYNADSRKLGISKEKKSFSEYYFPYADSYIVYEVKQNERRFCVWLHKKQNRLCFRFIDGPYETELVIKDRHALPESSIVAKATEKGYKLSRPIFKFSEYRDIIYGANKTMSRFSLIQNKSYHNIPRTISNIFLNSSLDGGFIKKTIINSLSDESFEINLDTNRHHLETARRDYQDVSEYLKHERKAQNIVSQYTNILQQEEQQKEQAWNIGASYNKAKDTKRLVKEEQESLINELNIQQELIKRIELEHTNKERIIQDKLANVKKDIKKANELKKYYTDKKITLVLEEHNKQEQYKLELSQTNAQLDLLTSDLKDIGNQYQINKQKLETQCQQGILDFEKSESYKKDQLNEELSGLKDQFYNSKENLISNYQAKISEQEKEHGDVTELIRKIEFEIIRLSQNKYFASEIDALKNQHQKLILEEQKLHNQEKSALLAKENTKKEGEKEKELLELSSTQKLALLNQEKLLLEDKIKTLQNDLNSMSGSLLEFLDKNTPAWQSNIGKVIKRDLLLRDDLNPECSEGNNLFGLNLNIEHINSVQLSKSELDEELSTFKKKLEEQIIVIKQFQNTRQDKEDKIQKKYNKKISSINEEIKQCQHNLAKTSVSLEKNKIANKHLIEKAELEKQQAIATKEAEKNEKESELKSVSEFITQLKNERDSSITEIEKQFRTKERMLKKQQVELVNFILIKAEEIETTFKIQLDQLLSQRNKQLEQKGADTAQIAGLETIIQQLNSKLAIITDSYKLIIEYEKDCKDYILRWDDFRQERKRLEKDFEHIKTLHNKRLSSELICLRNLQQKTDKVEQYLRDLSEQINKFENFKQSQLFQQYRSYIEHHDKKELWNCGELIENLKNVALEYQNNDRALNERITEFSGYFNAQNYLGFNTHINGQNQYRAFSQNLKEFVQEQKIIDYKTEVTRKYSMVLNKIVNDTNELLQKEEDVHKVINRINTDFKTSNFVGVVKSIEMRLQQSSNKIIQLLRKIRTFQTENAMDFGEINLFNQGGAIQKDDEAVLLLENLQTQIEQTKINKLSLDDAFDLEFRIRENENDTNWVSRLANIGSNGTDVLVKSMIYINLLHIFKNAGNKQKTDTTLHCLIDEVGILHDSNVTGLITFAGERNIRLINGSPNSHNEEDYKHIYMFRKNEKTNKTGITKLISNEL